MEVNRELPNLAAGLDESVHLLTPDGRMLVLAYHSLEDRMVKRALRRLGGTRRPRASGHARDEATEPPGSPPHSPTSPARRR